MKVLGITKFILVTRLLHLHAKSDQDQGKLIGLVANMVKNQQCYVKISAKDVNHNPFVSSIMARMPILLQDKNSRIKNKFNVCLLHVVVLSSKEDVRLVSFEKERSCTLDMRL